MPASDAPSVGFFVTCLVDLFRPSVGFASIKLLEQAGCTVSVPAGQTCCGQPAFNSGDRADAIRIARQTILQLESFDYVVVPSGSCAGMVRVHYPGLFADDPVWHGKAQAVASKTHELLSFLTDIRGIETIDGAVLEGVATYHDSCSSLREMGVKTQPRKLLGSVKGLELRELHGAEVCCGFGGTFCVKYPEISDRMVSDKVSEVAATGAALLLGGDMGCLMNMAGKLKREGKPIQTRHIAEVLAGMTDAPPIAET